MNYPPNGTKWKRGDLVLHDADAKRKEMLMRVVEYTGDGRCVTVYAQANVMNGDNHRRKPARWKNDIAVLHDPARFGVPANASVTGAGNASRARGVGQEVTP
jgi:hypothetical protein